MTSVTGYTAQRMKAIEDSSLISAAVVGDNLIMTRYDTTTINAGNVRGPQGIQGLQGDVNLSQLNTASPAGSMVLYPFADTPTGWLEMIGQTIANASTSYPILWGKAPIAWKSGSSLILPDTRGLFVVGWNSSDAAFDTLLETGGSKNAVAVAHTHGVSPHTHALPDHTHTVTWTPGGDGGHSHNFGPINTEITSTGSDYVTRLSAATDNNWATGKFMTPWDAISPPRLAGSGGFGESNTYAGMAVGWEASHVHTFSGSTSSGASSFHTHAVTVTGGGSGTGQVITNQSGGTSTSSQSPSSDGVNANLPPYLVIRYLIRAY